MREVALVLHFVGLTMGLGTGFAQAFLGIAASKMTADEAMKFRIHSLVLGKMGSTGIGLLILSGLYLITPYWKVLLSTPLLMVKLALVIVLATLISLVNVSAKKAIAGDAAAQFKKMAQLGKFTLILGIAIVILAVTIFH